MIPLKDETPSRTIPIVNISLILTNIIVFIYQRYFLAHDGQQIFFQWGFIPYELSHSVDINPKNIVPFPLTIITSMFIHGGWLHLLSNMLYLWIFGDNVEDRLGHLKYLFFYTMCGVLATLIHGLVNMNSRVPSVGASGAIAGVLSAYMIFFPKARINTLFVIFIFVKMIRLPAIIVLGYWIIIQVLSGFAEYSSQTGGGIAWFAHVGGFFSGLLLILIFRGRKNRLYL